MSKALLAISAAALRETPFFVLNGPDGRRLTCQWTSYVLGRAQGCEFEIVCPETPETMGCLFGLFEDGEFRMRPAIRPIQFMPHECAAVERYVAAPELDLDQEWRGDMNDVMDSGHDWRMEDDGTLSIEDPEEPAADPVDTSDLRIAA
jgi:hypothetical protein